MTWVAGSVALFGAMQLVTDSLTPEGVAILGGGIGIPGAIAHLALLSWPRFRSFDAEIQVLVLWLAVLCLPIAMIAASYTPDHDWKDGVLVFTFVVPVPTLLLVALIQRLLRNVTD